MDLPDCPPGAEGYEDSVVEMPKKPSLEEGECTKAEQEFQDHLNSLKIKVENAGARCMVERRGRDVSGKWIYLCYPCAAVCSGESILQTHISGKKHKAKLSLKNVWPQSIFDEHPYVLSEKGIVKEKGKDAPTEKVLQKMAEEVNFHNKSSELDQKYDKYRSVRCHIQDSLDALKAPLVGLEYLVEHPPEQAHYEPSYMCTLCHKQGHPRTIINHMTCFWHRYNYLTRHFTKATMLISPYRSQHMYREGVNLIINRLAQRIEDKYGRLKPVNFDKEMYEKERELIHQWICKGYHFSEKDGPTFEEVVDTGLIESLHKSNGGDGKRLDRNKKDPSPPVVAAPTKPLFNSYTRPAGRQERRASADALSDISDEPEPRRREVLVVRPHGAAQRFDPYRMRQDSPAHRYTNKSKTAAEKNQEKQKPPNYDYKQKLAAEQRQHAEDAAKKTLAYHEKNPEKHPLYPEEWKKFWNRRYKEIQAEGKDPSKHDFKPEWIVYWTARMKALHEEELRVVISEIYRKICLPVPDQGSDEKPPEPIRKSVERRRSPDPRRRSPDPRRRTPEPWRRSPDSRRRSPDPRRRSPMRRRSPDLRRRSPVPRRRTPDRRRSPGFDRYRMRKEDDRNRRDYRSPPRSYGESRHELHRSDRHRSRSPVHSRTRSPARTHFEIESVRRSRSPLSRRDEAAPLRNRSPARVADLAPSLQTVLISDDELRPEEDISPWNSDNEDSLGSLPEARSPAPQSRAGSEMSRASRSRREFAPHARPAAPADLGPPENVVATLRLLVALEDYLGSLGPKVVDLLTDALRMEKEKANSSEELLEREAAVALLETAKEKLKGAVQAGLVPAAAAPAVRAAVVRVAATLHEADTRAQRPAQKSNNNQKAATSRSSGASASAGGACGAGGAGAGVPVAGVGEVDRAQIAQQMAAALVAQGKTDVSSEELAQLVDAVVGMAEAKKREAEVKKKVEARAAERASRSAPPEPAQGKTASALQMLQSAYDENEKRIEKEDAPDAMDGLSDSDLETLLKNFNELSAEEQHSLIAYLKKLEAREPQRVEKLRQYVSAAADAPPPPLPLSTVTVESDDDDYAVEEVFQSATQKVKEDQIRQEMEIVKKSLEESTKVVPPPAETSRAPSAEAARGTSSATDLLALVQASLQPAPAPPAPPAGVVPSLTQPRSFGDRPDPPPDAPPPPDHAPPAWSQRPPPDAREPVLQEIPAQDARGPFDQDARGPFNSDNRGPFNQDGRAPFSPEARVPFNQDRGQFNLAPGGQFNQDSRVPFTPDVRTQFNQDNRGPPPFSDNRGGFNQGIPRPYTQDNRVPFNQDGRGTFNINVRGPLLQNNAGSAMQNNRGFPMQNNRGPPAPERGGFMPQDNRGPVFNNFGQDNMNRGSNFVDTRIQDMRPEQSQQQYGNFEQQHFRGRGGRGNFGGHMRGRGRGFY